MQVQSENLYVACYCLDILSYNEDLQRQAWYDEEIKDMQAMFEQEMLDSQEDWQIEVENELKAMYAQGE